jgi:DNA-binding NtrC family response regulator
VQLLRVLQEREVVRVGDTQPRPVDVRIVAATNRDLPAEVEAGRFRQDLLFRLDVIHVEIPPLRERPEDVAALVPVLLRRYAEELGATPPRLTREAHDRLLAYPLPGNVRELQNILQRAVILTSDDWIRAGDLPPPSSVGHDGAEALPVPDHRRSLPELVEQIERKALRRALAEHGGVRARAARALGIPERVLRYKLERYDMDPTKLSGSRQERREDTP